MAFGNDTPTGGNPDTASSADTPNSVDLSTCPASSSMHVELSYTSDENPSLASKRATEPELRPAAEVFGFLLEKRRPRTDKELPLAVSASHYFDSSTNRVPIAPMTSLNGNQFPLQSNSSQPVEASASTDAPSTVGSILFDPPHTATILNHTRIPVAHEGLTGSSRPEQLAVTVIATRRPVPSEHRSFRTSDSTLALAPETHLPSTSPTGLVKPILAPTPYADVTRSTANAAEQTAVVTPDVSFKQGTALLPTRSAHRRRASHDSGRPIPVNWGLGSDGVVGTSRVKRLKSDSGKENNARLCRFTLFDVIQ
jgi:hypothetical protein